MTSREPHRRISCARLTPDEQAGTATVAITASGGRSEVKVGYELTALANTASYKAIGFQSDLVMLTC